MSLQQKDTSNGKYYRDVWIFISGISIYGCGLILEHVKFFKNALMTFKDI